MFFLPFFLASRVISLGHMLAMNCGDLPCLPGLDALGRGFDLDRGTGEGLQFVFAFDEPGDSGFQEYTNPFNKSLVYQHPRSVQVIDNTGTTSGASSKSFFTTEEYRNSLTASVHAGAEYAGFGGSVAVEAAAKTLDDSQEYGSFAETQTLVRLYDATVDPRNAPLHDSIKSWFGELENDLNNSVAFFKFFRNFGTHYVSSATFGGSGKMTTSVGWKYSSHTTSHDISVQAQFHYEYLQAGASASNQQDKSDTDFLENSKFDSVFTGGDPIFTVPSPDSIKNWTEWYKSFGNSPAIVSFEVRPISDLVDSSPLAERMFNLSVEWVGKGAGVCANGDAELSRSSRKLACIRALLDSECCNYVTQCHKFASNIKCNCGDTIDLTPWGGVNNSKCERRLTSTGNCQSLGHGDSAIPKAVLIADIQDCLGEL